MRSFRLTSIKLLEKLQKSNNKLIEVIDKDGIQRGISPDLKEAFIVNEKQIIELRLENVWIKKTVTGGVDVKKYYILEPDKNIFYLQRDDDPIHFPQIKNFIESFKDSITCKEVKQGKHPIYALHRARKEEIFTKKEKIIGVITGDRIITALDIKQLYPTD